MSMSLASRSSTASMTARTSRVASVKPTRCASSISIRTPLHKASSPSRQVATKAVPVEVAQIAGEAAFIAGTAITMFSMTLVGLAIGFVLLRFEALTQQADK
ncbi:MAG: hypothetical protein WDW38_006737 [Sanguina aurantia]